MEACKHWKMRERNNVFVDYFAMWNIARFTIIITCGVSSLTSLYCVVATDKVAQKNELLRLNVPYQKSLFLARLIALERREHTTSFHRASQK